MTRLRTRLRGLDSPGRDTEKLISLHRIFQIASGVTQPTVQWVPLASCPALLISALEGDEWSISRPGRFTPRESAPDTHWIRGWVGPRAVLYAVVKREIRSPCQD
jgi:hypothetical protein